MNQVMENILNRRSTRLFTEESIKKEVLEDIIKAGIYAPSAMNQQPWHFTVISDKDLLAELSLATKEEGKKHPLEYVRNYAKNEKFQIFYNAPVAIVISGDEKAYEAEVDCAAATENILSILFHNAIFFLIIS